VTSFLLQNVGEESELDTEVVFGSFGLVLTDSLSVDGVGLVGHEEEEGHGGVVSQEVAIHEVDEILGEGGVSLVVQNSHVLHHHEDGVVVEVVIGTLLFEQFVLGSLGGLNQTGLGGVEEFLDGLFVGGVGDSPSGGHSVEGEEVVDQIRDGLWLHLLVLLALFGGLEFHIVEDLEEIHESDGHEEVGELGDEVEGVLQSQVVGVAGGLELLVVGEGVFEPGVLGFLVDFVMFVFLGLLDLFGLLYESLQQTQIGDHVDFFLRGFFSSFGGCEDGLGECLFILDVGEHFQEAVSELEIGHQLQLQFFVNEGSDDELFFDEEVGEFVDVESLEVGVVFEQLDDFGSVEVFVFGRGVSDEGLEGGEVGHEGGSGFDFVDLVDDGRNDVDQVGFSEFGLVVLKINFSQQ